MEGTPRGTDLPPVPQTCDCPFDGAHCPHCGGAWIGKVPKQHRDRCHRAAVPGMTADKSSRAEMLDLARDVAAGRVRPSIADSIIPLTAAESAVDPLAIFHRVLVPAIRNQDADLIASSLNLLMGQAA